MSDRLDFAPKDNVSPLAPRDTAGKFDDVWDLWSSRATATKDSKATNGACPVESIDFTIDVNGVETIKHLDTPYGEWLDQLKADSLNEPLPDKLPTFSDERQKEIAEKAVDLADRLMNTQPGTREFRNIMKQLHELFNGNRTTADPSLSKEYFKTITDYANMKLAEEHPYLRFGTSSISGAVVIGTRVEEGKPFAVLSELRPKITCPPNPLLTGF